MGWPEWFIFKWWRKEDEPKSFVTFGWGLGGHNDHHNVPGSGWFQGFLSSSSEGGCDEGFCLGCIRTAPAYLLVLSVFGIVASVLDVVGTHRRVLPSCDWRSLVPETNTDVLRTAKLVSSGLYIIIYADLFLGVCSSVADLLLPYLIVQLITILLAIAIVGIVAVKNRCALKRAMAIQLVFMIVNWLQCYCHYSVMSKPEPCCLRKTDMK